MHPALFLSLLDFLHVCIDGGYGRDIDNIADGAFGVGEVDRLVQSHLHRADNLHVVGEHLQQLICRTGTGKVGEHQGVDILAHQLRERIFLVSQLTVERIANLHFSVNAQFWHFVLHTLHGVLHLQ